MKSHMNTDVGVALNETESLFFLYIQQFGIPTGITQQTQLLEQFNKIIESQEQEVATTHRNNIENILIRIHFFQTLLLQFYGLHKDNFNQEQNEIILAMAKRVRKQLKHEHKLIDQSKLKPSKIQKLKDTICPQQLIVNSAIMKVLINLGQYYAAESYFSESYDLTYLTPFDTKEQIRLNRASFIVNLAMIAAKRNDYANLENYLLKSQRTFKKIKAAYNRNFYELALKLAITYRLKGNHQKAIEWFSGALDHETNDKQKLKSFIEAEQNTAKKEIMELIPTLGTDGFTLTLKDNKIVVEFKDAKFRAYTTHPHYTWNIYSLNLDEFKRSLSQLKTEYENYVVQKDYKPLASDIVNPRIQVVDQEKPKKVEEESTKQMTESNSQNTPPVQLEPSTTVDVTQPEQSKKRTPATDPNNNNNQDNSTGPQVKKTLAQTIFGDQASGKTVYELRSKYSSARFFGYYDRAAINAKTTAMTDDDHVQYEKELAKETVGKTVRYVKGKETPTFKIAPPGNMRIWSDVETTGVDSEGKKCFFLKFGNPLPHKESDKEHLKKTN